MAIYEANGDKKDAKKKKSSWENKRREFYENGCMSMGEKRRREGQTIGETIITRVRGI